MAVISDKWAIQRIFTLDTFDIVTGASRGRFSDMKTSTFTNDATIVYADGGAGNVHIAGFSHSKRATLDATNAVFDFPSIGLVMGATPITGSNTDLVVTDIRTVTSNAATTSYTALGTVGSEIGTIYIRNTDGTLGESFLQVTGTPTTGQFKYVVGTKALTFFAGDITDSSQIVMFYNATSGANTKTIKSYTDVFADAVKVVANGIVQDVCSKQDFACQLIFDTAQAANKFELSLTADGDPAVQNVMFEALKPCGTNLLWQLIVFDETETV